MKNYVSLILLFLLLAGNSYAQSTVVVTGNTASAENSPGWMFNRDVNNVTPIEFNTNKASIGAGSLFVRPIGSTAAAKFIGEYFLNRPISEIDSISGDFLLGTPNSYAQFYINVYANFAVSDDFKFYDCKYDVVATVGSTSNFTTLVFDPTAAYPVTQRSSSPHTCPAIPANMDSSTTGSGATIRMFSLNTGDTSTSDIGVSGYWDKVIVAASDGSTTFDFEPVLTPTSADQCKKGGWMTFNTPAFSNQGSCVSYVMSNSPNH